MEDASMAQAFSRREPWAFDEAYRRYGALLYSTALNVLASAEDAEDCVHDVLVRVWKRQGAFALERGTVRSFLTVCVRNEAISRKRSAARQQSLANRLQSETSASEEFDIPDFVENARLERALRTLPADQRDALALAYFGGMTHVQVAERLSEPLGTVKSRIALALRKLAKALNEDPA